MKRPPSDEGPESKRLATQTGQVAGSSASPVPGIVQPKMEPGATKPIERIHADAIVNFLLRLACQVNDNPATTQGNQGELLSKRCVALLKMALKPDVWPQSCDLKIAWMDKVFATVETPNPIFLNICTALETVTFLLGVMKKEHILQSFKPLQKGLGACIASTNTKVIK